VRTVCLWVGTIQFLIQTTFAKMDQTSNLKLPLEVLDLIFGFLRGNNRSLEAIWQVNTVFSKVVERHLYCHIDVSYHLHRKFGEASLSTSSSTSKLFNFLHESPRITSYVESLRIIFDRGESRSPPISADFPVSILALPRLKKVHLYTGDDWLSWNQLPQSFRLALLRRIQSTDTEEFFLSSLESFPIHELNKCTALKCLSLSHIFLFDNTSQEDQSQTHRCDLRRLQSLSVRYCDPDLFRQVASWFLTPASPPPVPASSLRSLHLRIMGRRDLRMVSDILKACLKTLVSLEFDASSMCEYSSTIPFNTLGSFDANFDTVYTPVELTEGNVVVPDPITLSLEDAPSLEYLTIRSVMATSHTSDFHHRFPETPIPPICRLVRTLPKPSSLRYLSLILAFRGDEPLEPGIDWSVLEDTILSGCLPSLIKLELMVCAHQLPHEPSREVLAQWLRNDAVLSRLIHRGLLSVGIEPVTVL